MTAHGIQPGFHLRSVFLSDLHLGFRGCAAELLTDFLERARIDHLYLLGDILDVSSLRRGFYWPKSHNSGCVSDSASRTQWHARCVRARQSR